MKKILLVLLAAAFLTGMLSAGAEGAPLRISVTVPDTYEGELNGRLLFMFDRNLTDEWSFGPTGVPVFGKTFYGLKAGDVITLSADDPEVFGSPMQLSEVPPGEYAAWVTFQKYTKFTRSDGSVVWGMADHGGGGYGNPYNLGSDAKTVTLSGEVAFSLDYEIPLGYELKEGQVTQQGNYEDTELVKYLKIRSGLLSEFWGTDIYLGANVLLPRGYDASRAYPVLYFQGYFPGGDAPLDYGNTAPAGDASPKDLTNFWNSVEAPEIIVVTFRDANMFYDTSYSVNSANLGPWGDAIMTELIPYVEQQFNIIREPWARALAGRGVGGWEALAMQIFHPDFFGGVWSISPEPIDFSHFQLVDIYEDDNAYYADKGWLKVERPSFRDQDGMIQSTIRDECLWEAAAGGVGHPVSLGQYAIWSARESVFSPQGEDGYPKRIWDPLTGKIDHDVAAYWKEHYDLYAILQANWATLGPKLVGKIHLRGNGLDPFYNNLAIYEMGNWLEGTTDPYYDGYFSYLFEDNGRFLWDYDLLKETAQHMIKYGPENAAEILGVQAE